MKTLRLTTLFTVLLIFVAIVRCSEDDPKPIELGTLSGTVTYPNTAGTQTPAVGAKVTLMGTAGVLYTVTDEDGMYKFANLDAGEYDMHASYFVTPETAARVDGLNFATESDVAITMTSADLTQNLTLVSVGQGGADYIKIVANYTWDGANYVQPANPAWQFDNGHSLVAFEFPYRAEQADFTGSFKQIHKFVVTFDPSDLAGSSISAEVDMASIDTRTPGGRDNRTTVADNPTFSPNTDFTEFGCVAPTFGIEAAGSWIFTVTAANATVGATYTYTNPTTSVVSTFTVTSTIAGATTLECTAVGNRPASGAGTLTKSTGTGDATIAYSAFTVPTAPSEGTPKKITGDDADRYAKFTSSSITKYGDGYLAKGNLVWHGVTVPVDLWFKQIPKWFDSTNSRTYSGFEGKFLMDAKGDYNIISSSVNDAILRIQLTVIGYTQG